jgi:hypothetical protein
MERSYYTVKHMYTFSQLRSKPLKSMLGSNLKVLSKKALILKNSYCILVKMEI